MPAFLTDLGPYVVIAAIVVAVLLTAVNILREYERAVVFTLGRFSGVRDLD